MVLTRVVVIGAVIITVAAVALVSSLHRPPAGDGPTDPVAPPSAAAPVKPRTFLGVYEVGVPESYSGIRAFTATTGVRPGVVVYYSGWMERFQARFAAVAARHGAATLVQINPTGTSLAAIAAGRYDSYLRSFASSVKAFGGRVILSFGHEMNGPWYPWGYQHTSPTTFVAAWRHIVTVFRAVGARNATWLWTVNVMHPRGNIPSPARWWPGSAYVNWVGIDGYYYRPAWTFASLFGPTIKAIRALTLDPILIAETGATPAAGKPAKIANLFAGVRAYGLLGFVWFDANRHRDWRISGPAAFAAFRRGARAYQRRALSATGGANSLASGAGSPLIFRTRRRLREIWPGRLSVWPGDVGELALLGVWPNGLLGAAVNCSFGMRCPSRRGIAHGRVIRWQTWAMGSGSPVVGMPQADVWRGPANGVSDRLWGGLRMPQPKTWSRRYERCP